MKRLLAAIAATLFVASLGAAATACPYMDKDDQVEKPKESETT